MAVPFSGISFPLVPEVETAVGILGDCCGDCGGCDAGPCDGCGPDSTRPGAPGCSQQVILFLVPAEHIAYYNASIDYKNPHGCDGGEPAPPSSFDYAATVAQANAFLSAFNWDSPPLPWSPNEFFQFPAGYLCPGMQALRYWLGTIDVAGHIGYVWDNSDRRIDVTNFGFIVNYCPADLQGSFTGMTWASLDFSTPCPAPGYSVPFLIATATRHRGIVSVCESLVNQEFAETSPGSGLYTCGTRNVLSCGLITRESGHCLFAGGGSGYTPISFGGPSDPPDATPALGYIDWLYAPCTDCACP